MPKILIVDDNAQNLYMLEILLKTNGFTVDQALNGAEALELARADPPDAIISDILMPTMDGFRLCRIWKEDEKLNNIPFIFYTATYVGQKDEEFAMSLGAERYVIKPTPPDELLSILNEVLRSRVSQPKEITPTDGPKENEFYKGYNEALIRKLEDKMIQLEKSNKRLTSLYNISRDMHVMQPTASLIQIFLQAIVENAGYYYASYFSLDESQNTLSLLATVGFAEETATNFKDRLTFALGEKRGLVGQVAQNGQIVNVADTSREPNWVALDQTIQSALFTPVHFEKKLLGVIGLFGMEKNAFTDEDEHDILVLSNNLALAIENITNQEQVKKQLARISALHAIDKVIMSSSDMGATLNVVLEHVTSLLKIDAADVLLSRPGASINEYAAGRGFRTPAIQRDVIRSGRSLDKKVVDERRVIHEIEIPPDEVSAEFVAMWEEEGFQTYLGAPLIAKNKMIGILEVYHRAPFKPDPDWMSYFETLAGQAALAIDNATLVSELQASNRELLQSYDSTIEGWSRAMDLRDKETEGHTLRVTDLTLKLARMMGMSEQQIINVRRGALLHDVGKLGIPDQILLKPGPLSEEEWAIMRMHPQFAYDMVSPIEYLKPAIAIPYCHHERWDGSGYPRGLRGAEIPLEARLFAVIDVWDALTSDRPYRKRWSQEDARKYLIEQAGKQFDPRIVDVFLAEVLDSLENDL